MTRFIFLLIGFNLVVRGSQEIHSLRELALHKAALELNHHIKNVMEGQDRHAIVKRWDEKAGILVQPHYAAPILPQFTTSKIQNETVVERLARINSGLKSKNNFKHTIKAISSDGSKIITNSNDLTYFSVYNSKKNNRRHKLRHTSSGIVLTARFSSNNEILATTAHGELILWDMSTGKPLCSMRENDRFDLSAITRLYMTTDPTYFVSQNSDYSFTLYNLNPQNHVAILGRLSHFDGIKFLNNMRKLSLLPNTSKILIVSGCNTTIWDFTNNTLLALMGHTETVNDCAFFEDYKKIISCGWDRTVRVWDIETAAPLAVLENHSKAISKIKSFDNNAQIVSNSIDETIKIWDLKANKVIYSLPIDHVAEDIALSKDNTKLFETFYSDDYRTCNLVVWDLSMRMPIQKIKTNGTELVTNNNYVCCGTMLHEQNTQDWKSIANEISED